MPDMLLTGNQLKAARALADLTQAQLAKAAVVDVTTISSMESRKAATLRSGLDTIRAIMTALEAAGVELLAQGPGVRLKGGN
jgi:transcriptional regulator with XRE-family HTH domain